jgi:hypothetical protein
MSTEHRLARCAICIALIAATFCVQPDRARAQTVDFDLLIESLKERARPIRTHPPGGPTAARASAELLRSARPLEPVQELMEYEQCLRNGRCAFLPTRSGEEVATELGYTRLFASAYEEVRLQVRTREYVGDKMRPEDITAHFAAILDEEQKLDQMMQRRDGFSPSIAYLRALQNGDIVFPHPSSGETKPEALLNELKTLAPDLALVLNDPLFVAMFAETRAFSDVLFKEIGEVTVYHIISDFRQQIVSHMGQN